MILAIDAMPVTWYSQTRLSKAGRVSGFGPVLQQLYIGGATLRESY